MPKCLELEFTVEVTTAFYFAKGIKQQVIPPVQAQGSAIIHACVQHKHPNCVQVVLVALKGRVIRQLP